MPALLSTYTNIWCKFTVLLNLKLFELQWFHLKEGKSEGSHSCDQLSNLTQIGLKSSIHLDCMTLKFDAWPWKKTGHLFYATSSFVNHFIAIGQLKMQLQYGNAQFRSKSHFFSRVTSTFDRWPWKTIRHIFYAISSFVHHFTVISKFKLVLQFGNVQSGSKSAIFCHVWPYILTDDLENQNDAFSMLFKALCII